MELKRKLYSLNFLYAFGYTMVSKLMPAILAVSKIAESAFQISFVNAGYHVARSISVVYSGYLSDRIRRRKSILVAFSVTAIGAFLMLFADSIMLYAVAFFIVGAVATILYLSLGAVSSIIFRKKAEAFSKLEASYQLGFVLGPLVGGALSVYLSSIDFSVFGFQLHLTAPLIFIAWIGVCLIGFLVSLSLPMTQKGEISVKETLRWLFTDFSSNRFGFFLFFLLSSFFVGFVEGARDILVPLRAVDLGMGVLGTGIIFSVSAVITMVGVVPGSSVADRFGRGLGTLLGFGLVAVAFLLIGFTDSLLVLALLTGILSLGRSIALTTNRAFASDIVKKKFRSTGLSASDALFLVGRVVGPLTAGFLKDVIPFLEAVSFFATAALGVMVISAVYYIFKEVRG